MSLRLAVLVMVLSMTAAATLRAQEYPNKTVRIVASTPGGFADVSARLLANGLASRFGKPVIVENRSGNLAVVDYVVKANPDGYTLLLFGNGVWLARYLFDDLKYDPMKELQPISLTTATPYVLVVHPSVQAKTVSELIALAKAKPGELNYAYLTAGGTPQLAAELFKAMTRANVVGVPYRGSGGVNAVLAGEVQFMFAQGSVFSYVKTGRLRGLAVTTAEPTPLIPGLPTLSASGLTGFEAASIQAVFVPAKTPSAISGRLNADIVATLNDPVTKQRFFDVGAETIPGTPAEARTKANAEATRLGSIIKSAGIKDR